MRRSIGMLFFAAAVLAAVSAQLGGGGFWLVLGNPAASEEAKAMHAVLTIKSAGCHEPEKAQITGRAIGVAGGRRQIVELKLMPMSTPGMYALTRQWPAEGKWVVVLTGKSGELYTSAIAVAGPDGVDRSGAKLAMGKPDPKQTDELLVQ